jgi:hemoglobin-like flavoprotein
MVLPAETTTSSTPSITTTTTIGFEAVRDVTSTWERIITGSPDHETTFADTFFRNIIERIFFAKQEYNHHQEPTAAAISASSSTTTNNNNNNGQKRSSMSHIDDKNPSTNPLFKIKSQLFVQMLSVAIDMLGPDLAPMEEMLIDLGAKHLDYGVLDGDYDIIGDALLMTLKSHLLRDEWNDRWEQSWRCVYNFMASCMKKGSQQEEQARKKGGGGGRRHLKRSSIPPRHNKTLIKLDNDEIAAKLKEQGKGLLGMLDKALVISKK